MNTAAEFDASLNPDQHADTVPVVTSPESVNRAKVARVVSHRRLAKPVVDVDASTEAHTVAAMLHDLEPPATAYWILN